MAALISLLIVLTLSLLITRIATVALTHTGLSREVAQFQARSAFTGVGFTTGESEKVVQHPVRQRILMLLMLLGNAGFVSAVSSLLLTFTSPGGPEGLLLRLLFLGIGILVLWALATSPWADRYLSRLIKWAFVRPNDTLILYGQLPFLTELEQRRHNLAAQQAHRRAVAEQQRVLEKQDRQEAAEGN